METPASNRFVLVAFFFEAGLGALAIAIGWFVGFDALATLPASWQAAPELARSAGIGLAAAVPLFASWLVLERLPWRPLLKLQKFVTRQLLPFFRPLSIFELAAIAIAAGFGEEVLFRGLIQAGLAQWIGPPSGLAWSLVVASVLFGLCHWLTPTYAFLATLIGVYLGMLYLLTGGLLAPLVAHAAYDFAALLYLTRRAPRDGI